MTIITSDGLKLPRETCPKVRIRVMVMTIVDSTTRVAPKLRANSFRIEEWNNIDADFNGQRGAIDLPTQYPTILENLNYEL